MRVQDSSGVGWQVVKGDPGHNVVSSLHSQGFESIVLPSEVLSGISQGEVGQRREGVEHIKDRKEQQDALRLNMCLYGLGVRKGETNTDGEL